MGKRKRTTRSKKMRTEGEETAQISTLDSFLSIDGQREPVVEEGLPSTRGKASEAPVTAPKASMDDTETVLKVITTPMHTKIHPMRSQITAEEARSFLKDFGSSMEEKGSLGIYFHNDMDGLNGALFIRSMAFQMFGDRIEIHSSPLEYKEIQKLTLDPSITYVFIDMDLELEGDNIFRIDHHGPVRDLKKIDGRTFVLTPSENDYEYPSTATGLCAYLDYVSRGGAMTYFDFLDKGPWHEDQFSRILILLASVCDNLWHLNFLIDIPIKRWIPDKEEEKYLILISISASIILGEERKRNEIVERFFTGEVSPQDYLSAICQGIPGARNIMDFTYKISREAESFYNRIFFNLTDSIEQSLRTLERDRETYRKLLDSMPIDMKNNREKMMELLNTQGDLNEGHWRRVKFYGKELSKLEAKIKVEEKRLTRLRAAKKMISTEKGPRLCVMLPLQISIQVKGIIASLLYYMGWKNVVIEERGSESFWGSRGFSREYIDRLFSNLSLGYEELKDYLFMEKVFKDLPDVFKRTHNISKNISFYKTYSGGMGGRGLIFGGMLTGKVPWVFSMLEETGEMEEKIKELMLHKQLGNALQGLTEGQSTVSTAQALRAKFKSTGWMVIQLVQGRKGADVLLGNFSLVIMSLVGYTERIQVPLNEIPPPLEHMEHGKFEVVD
ncbi:MAG: hypothetical protein ACMUHB_03895 [Thermoplasmatota archaeon]